MRKENKEPCIGDYIITTDCFSVYEGKDVVVKEGFSGIILFIQRDINGIDKYGIMFGPGLPWCYNLKNELSGPNGCWLESHQFELD